MNVVLTSSTLPFFFFYPLFMFCVQKTSVNEYLLNKLCSIDYMVTMATKLIVTSWPLVNIISLRFCLLKIPRKLICWRERE